MTFLRSGAMLLCVAALSSCGFDYATDRVNNNGAGTTNRGAVVDVVGAVIVAGQDNAGTVVATLSNNDAEETISLVEVAGAEGAELTPTPFEPLEVAPEGYVNLAALAEEQEGITVTGEFAAGDVVPAVLRFDNNETVEINLPVVKPCYQYEGLDSQPGDELAEETETSEDSEDSEESENDTYGCEEPEGAELEEPEPQE